MSRGNPGEPGRQIGGRARRRLFGTSLAADWNYGEMLPACREVGNPKTFRDPRRKARSGSPVPEGSNCVGDIDMEGNNVRARGFAAMDQERQREIARKGGKA